jgi:hypothetical protein
MRTGWRWTENVAGSWLKKWILDDQIPKPTPLLHVLAIKDLATAL